MKKISFKEFAAKLRRFFLIIFGFVVLVLIWPYLMSFLNTRPLHGKYVLVDSYSDELGKSVFDATTPVELSIDSRCLNFKYYLDGARCIMTTKQCDLKLDNDSYLHVDKYKTTFSPNCKKSNEGDWQKITYIYRKDKNKLYLTNPKTKITDTFAEN